MTIPTQHLLDKAAAEIQKGKYAQAQRLLKKALREAPNSAQVHHYLGLVAYQQHQYTAATEHIAQSLSLQNNDPVVHHNHGLALLARNKTAESLEAFKQALALDPLYTEAWLNCGNVQRRLQNLNQACADYEKALSIDPFFTDALNNLGLTKRHLGHLAESVDVLERCLEIQPNHHFALNNLGLTRQIMGDYIAAKALFERAVELAPSYVEGHVNLGNLLLQANDFASASEHYEVAYRLAPDMDLLAGYLTQSKAMQCQWNGLEALWWKIEKQIDQGQLPCSPFELLSFCDDPRRSLAVARRYAQRHVHRPKVHPPSFEHKPVRQKLRLGYISSDFRDHPVAYLTVGILEAHDRSSVEVFGFAIQPPQDTALGQRMRQSVDHFVDLSKLTDADAVNVIRQHDIDIAIDLNGYIEGCRPNIFKARVAPVQVNYYGYPGTMGADFIDYIIGDPSLIPENLRDQYQEKIIYLPHCYQPNDDKRQISPRIPERKEQGLPSDGFVFCSFNKPYKITPAVFSCWMSILRQTDNSVLWLQSSDPNVIENLRREAVKANIDSSRIVFAGRTPSTEDHLARYQLADLFLDTYPYTAHTTANDALWVGLPVLGLSGQTFSARVSTSLLNALDLPDLVMPNLDCYVEKAVALANRPQELAGYKDRLAIGKTNASLYKPAQIARYLEQGLHQAHATYLSGDRPQHIVVAGN